MTNKKCISNYQQPHKKSAAIRMSFKNSNTYVIVFFVCLNKECRHDELYNINYYYICIFWNIFALIKVTYLRKIN